MSIIDSPKKLPSVDRLLNDQSIIALIDTHGLPWVTRQIRISLQVIRDKVIAGDSLTSVELLETISHQVASAVQPSLRRAINLTGTLLHTNLGRAALPETAIAAMNEVARGASNLEYDLKTGKRGDRHTHCATLVAELTGADSAVIVNNNAAAVLLTLNSLALRKEVPVSRGELIEIGGAFRMPDIMSRAGCKLVEVGTTNRTHPRDFEMAIGRRTALLMKVHTSNYEIQGFTKVLGESEMADIAKKHEIPLLSDLGSGTLVDLGHFGLPHEPTVREVLDSGVDLVTFSGDKLLGGPQAGIIAGRSDLIEKIKRNPMTRALRPDKLTLAALQAVLHLYRNPDQLAETLPTFRLLSRSLRELEQIADRIKPAVSEFCDQYQVDLEHSHSQIGSGALPVNTVETVALKITRPELRRPGKALAQLAGSFRGLPIPVIGRITDDALWLDLRCLTDIDEFITNLQAAENP
ncbi:MAG: L-seryl-tRNA(Sec) selenium transferase [Pseudomonadota bacterium]